MINISGKWNPNIEMSENHRSTIYILTAIVAMGVLPFWLSVETDDFISMGNSTFFLIFVLGVIYFIGGLVSRLGNRYPAEGQRQSRFQEKLASFYKTFLIITMVSAWMAWFFSH